MKAINNYISNPSKNFERKVRRLLPKSVEKFTLTSVQMVRASGYGNYCFVLDCEINGEITLLKNFTHNSCAFDDYKDLDYGTEKLDRWKKNAALSIIENNYHKIDEVASIETDEY